LTRFESIRYVHLRAEECGYSPAQLEIVKKELEALNEDELEHFKRISETEFRDWCNKINEE